MEKDISKTINLEQELPKKLYDELVKYDFIKVVEGMLDESNLISIDVGDLKVFAKSELVGAISQVFGSTKEKYQITTVSNKEPNSCIFHVSSDGNLTLRIVEDMMAKLKGIYPNLQFVIGTGIIPELKGKVKIDALLFHCE